MKPFYERYEEFKGIEIQNVSMVIDPDTGELSYESGLEDPDMYGVYMILKEGTAEHIADVPTRAIANYLAILVRCRFRELHPGDQFEIHDKTFGDGE